MGSMSFGKYRLLAELGHGGMADVFLAVQAGPAGSGFRKLTVVKRLRQNLAEEPEFVAMLVDEARIAARLNHPNVVQTNEVGNVGNQYFIAMEYLDGQPLHRIQHRSTQRAKVGATPPLSAHQQYLILMDALAGLHHAHELADYDGTPLDIVHRDMTPQNVFVTYEGQVKVVDFGIAKAAGRASETRQGVVKGKVRYMAPEQAIGLAVSRRSDVFAVGIMLWEAAAGRRMWQDKDDLQIVHALVSGDLPPMPREVDPNVPEEVDRICRKALALRPEDRYATADEFRGEIEHYLANSGKLVETRRQLAPTVAELFKDKRSEIRAIIEKQLASIEDAPESSSGASELMFVPQDSASKANLRMTMRNTPITISLPPAGMTPPAEPSVRPPAVQPVPNNKRPALFAAAAAVALVAALGIWKTSASGASATARPTAHEVEEVHLRLTATPAGARVSVDGQVFQPLPLDVRVPRDDTMHRVRIEADGYEPRVESLSFASNIQMAFDLVKSPAQPTPATSASAAKPPPPPTTAVAIAPAPWRPSPGPKPAESKPTEPKVEPSPPQPPHPHPAPSGSDPKARNLSLDKGDPWGQK